MHLPFSYPINKLSPTANLTLNMSDGGCFCGKVRYTYEGDALGKAICHCKDCHKISGSTYSTNIIVSGDGFKVTSGTPKEYTVKGVSGREITSHFCGDCGSTLFRSGEAFGPNKCIKVGTIDDPQAFEKAKPGVELFTSDRVSWVPETPDTKQLPGMM
ncbi:Mss4-like protein [Xylariaceae sp. FL1019]|nr:Mss4-like protein [Xylariaceae sp. FL1019]